MSLDLFTRAAALIAVFGTAVVYGTDVFCAIVLRPALEEDRRRALVAVMGSVHRYGTGGCRCPGARAWSPPRDAVLAVRLRALGSGDRGGRRPAAAAWSGWCSTHG